LKTIPLGGVNVPATKIKPTRTYVAKPGELQAKWFLVDATDKVVGRLASEIAMVLMGKHRPTYTPHVDCGDFVVVTNAEKIKYTGKKWAQKEYRWYTGYHGLMSETAEHRRDRRPELIIIEAVRRMLPKSKLGMHMLTKLKVYGGDKHPHQAQEPEPKEMGVKKQWPATTAKPKSAEKAHKTEKAPKAEKPAKAHAKAAT
jgi:large subunit ribosomal protein L13